MGRVASAGLWLECRGGKRRGLRLYREMDLTFDYFVHSLDCVFPAHRRVFYSSLAARLAPAALSRIRCVFAPAR